MTPVRIPIEEAACPWCGGEVQWRLWTDSDGTLQPGPAWCSGSDIATILPGSLTPPCPANWSRSGQVERGSTAMHPDLVLYDPKDIIVFHLRQKLRKRRVKL